MMLQSTRRKRLFSILIATAFLLFLGLQAAPARAGTLTITSFDIQLGTWDGSSFTSDGNEWNTYYYGPNWAIGATNPGWGNSLLDYNGNVDLAPGNYWLYMASTSDNGNAIQLTIGQPGSIPSITEVFTSAGGSPSCNGSYSTAECFGGYTRVQGSGFELSFVSGPQSNYELVGGGQTYSSDGSENWVVDFSTPEPSTAILLPIALLALAFVGRKRLAPGL
jgi:hypothetical protein